MNLIQLIRSLEKIKNHGNLRETTNVVVLNDYTGYSEEITEVSYSRDDFTGELVVKLHYKNA